MPKGKSGASSSRRKQVANACQACRVSKVKCSGKHPTCTRCSTRGLECSYDVSEEGMTKRQHLRNEYSEQRKELDSALGVLDVLRDGSDQEATMVLARLRLGQSVEQMYEDILASKGESQLEDADSVEDDMSAPPPHATTPSAQEGPYPPLDQNWPSNTSPVSESSDLSHSRRMMLPNIAISSNLAHPEYQQNQQQQGFAANETRHVNWHPPITAASQTSPHEGTSAAFQQFEQADYGADHMIAQRDLEDPSPIT